VKSVAHLQTLLKQRTWDKEVLLWIGPEKELLQALGPARIQVLDLLDLFNPQNLPIDEEETRQQLREGLRTRLRMTPKGPDSRTVFIVKSVGLLARYNAGLKEFYDWFISDFTMVMLLLDGAVAGAEWPEEVRCQANRLISYFSEPSMVKDVISATG
jgi:hypothetical protein